MLSLDFQAFLPHMLERRSGHVVTIASVLGLVAADKISDYVASKFGQVGLDESLRAQFYLLGKDDPVAKKGVGPLKSDIVGL